MTLQCHGVLLLRKCLACLFTLLLCLTGSVPLSSLPVLAQGLQYGQPAPELTNEQKRELQIDLTVNAPKSDKQTQVQTSSSQVKSQVVTEPVSKSRLEQIAISLPPLTKDAIKQFKLATAGPVKPQVTTVETLPALTKGQFSTAKPQPSKVGPLKITRVSDQGKLTTVSQLAITFNQPMIALKAAATVSPTDILSIQPKPDGTYRWLGDKTILFTPARGRLPRATHYTVTIPTTTKSIYGQSLVKPYIFSIDTPPVTALVIVKSQDKARTTTPLIVATFDQDIDRQSVFKLLSMTQANNPQSKTALRMVADTTVLSDKSLKEVLSQYPNDQWLAFEPANALPKATTFTVKFASGLPSKEGPLKSQQAKSFDFSTYGPLKLISQPVPNTSPESWNSQVFEFSNTLAQSSFDAKLVKIQPTAPELKIDQQDSRISITGDLKALTTYTVTFDKTLTDEYGQKLGTNLVTRFTTGKREPALEHRDQLVTLPKFASPVYSIKAQGIPQIKITVRKVKPTYWCEYANLTEPKYKTKIKGQIVETKVVSVGQNKKTIEVNLAPHLTRGYGHLIVTVESLGTKPDQAQGTATWVQVTNLGADVTSGNTLTTLVTNLTDGKFVQGATVELLPNGAATTSSEYGLARLLAPQTQADHQFLLVTKGDDTSITPNNNNQTWYQTWIKTQVPIGLKWYVVTDRNLYKPGETVNFKGYCRLLTFGERDEFIQKLPALPKLAYKITDSAGIAISEGECPIDAAGAFSFSTKVPDKVNLGSANVVIQALPKADSHISQVKKSLISGFEETSQVVIKTQDGKTIEPSSTQNISNFMIQEFRAPEFEMKVKSSAGSVLNLQESTDIVANTKYFAGGTLTETPVNWQITATPRTFSPAGWSDYKFCLDPDMWSRGRPVYSEARTTTSLTTHTGADGQSTVSVKVDKASDGLPTSVTCKAEVLDLNRQSWSDDTTILVHPSDYYIGLKSSQNYYHSDKPLDFQLIVTDKEGKAKPDCAVNLKLMMSQAEKPDKLIEEQTLKSAATPIAFSYKPQPGGEYKLIATVSDSKGHKSKTTISTWVQGKQEETFTTVQSQTIEVLPSKTSYQPGEKAEVVIFSPFYPAQGTLTVRRLSVVHSIPLTINSNATTVEVPVTSDYYSDFAVHVQLSGKSAVYGEGLGKITVKPLEHKLTVTAATPKTEYAPGADSVIDVSLSDSSGKPVANGEVAIAVIDESILALTGYKWGDPLETFYPEGSGNLYDIHNRETVVLPVQSTATIKKAEEKRERYYDKNPWDRKGGLVGAPVDPRFGQSNEVGQLGDAMAALPPPSALPPPPLSKEEVGRLQFAPSQASSIPTIAMRTNLASLALFEPGVITDQNGKATVKLHLPDNLTSYRIMAIAAAGSDNFGTAESSLTARLPLSIKPSAPRFLNFGDSCELPLMVYNQTDNTVKTEVVLQATNARLNEKADSNIVYSANDLHTTAKSVEVKAHDRVEVRFAMTTEDIGKIKLQCAAIADDKNDATYFEIPVQTPATTESTAAYGEIDGEQNAQVISQKLEVPVDTYDQVGGLSVTTSSTAMQNLLDSYIYLRDYQLDCSEQLSSRIIATLSLQNVLSAFGRLDDRDNALIRNQIQKDVDQLLSRQKDNGGFGLWSRDDRQSWPYVTLQTIEALNLAKGYDYKVNPDKLALANALLRNLNSEIPSTYGAQSRLALHARALSMRSQLKDNDPRAARVLVASALALATKKGTTKLSAVSVDQVRAALTLECAAWLLDVVGNDKNSTVEADLLRRYINSEIVETASTASIKSSGYGAYDYCMFYSNHRAEAVLLQALIKDNANNPIISKLAKGLLNSRKSGLWNGPQENHVIIKALQKYFATYEKKSPDFVVRLWLNDVFAGEETYKGRSAASKTIEVPVSYLKQNKVTDLTLSKAGAGRLYYRFALDYAPRQATLKPADFGFGVERTYEGVQNKDDAKKDQSGIWHFKAGALIRSKIKFTASGSRYHVALIDPLPAGAEAVNTELSGNIVLDAPVREEKYPVLTDSGKDNDADIGGKLPVPPPAIEQTDTVQPWWEWPWFEHQNLRDQQAEAFASELYAGDYSYSYLMRATTPGEYIVPPTKVLEMYETETFGRAASERVIVE